MSSNASKQVAANNNLRLLLVSILLALICISFTDCAPTSNNGSNNISNTNRILRSGLFSNLFRRQNGNGNSDSTTTSSSSTESDTEEPQTQTELDAQKFMDSLPNQSPTNSGPTTFRERVSDTFGVLRDGVNNHFRSIRDNFSDTVEDLRETWSNSQD